MVLSVIRPFVGVELFMLVVVVVVGVVFKVVKVIVLGLLAKIFALLLFMFRIWFSLSVLFFKKND